MNIFLLKLTCDWQPPRYKRWSRSGGNCRKARRGSASWRAGHALKWHGGLGASGWTGDVLRRRSVARSAPSQSDLLRGRGSSRQSCSSSKRWMKATSFGRRRDVGGKPLQRRTSRLVVLRRWSACCDDSRARCGNSGGWRRVQGGGGRWARRGDMWRVRFASRHLKPWWMSGWWESYRLISL